jgi:hypothetical protein
MMPSITPILDLLLVQRLLDLDMLHVVLYRSCSAMHDVLVQLLMQTPSCTRSRTNHEAQPRVLPSSDGCVSIRSPLDLLDHLSYLFLP